MSTRRTPARFVAVGAIAMLALSACGGSNSGSDGESDTGVDTGPAAADAPSADAGEVTEIRVWLNGADTPDEAREYLVTTFEEENPGATLVIEEQQWTGIVDKLTTSLSGSDSPDVVEVGNTQSPAFSSAGAFLDLTDQFEALGGDDLLPGFVEAGSYDGQFFAAPYYSGARVVFYRADLYEAAGLSVPTTLDEYIANGKALTAANPELSGIYFPGQDWYNALPYIWEAGGELATFDNGEWAAGLSSPESIEGLTTVQDVMTSASVAPKDGDEADAQVPFCAGAVGQLSAPSWFGGSILAPADAEAPGCPEQEANLGVFALPGADGEPAQVFAGGSNIAVSANSEEPELALSAVQIMLSPEYQTILGEAGLVPALLSLGDTIGTDETAQAITAAASNAKLTPASPNWATVEAEGVLQDFFSQIALGGDVTELAAEADGRINEILNS